MQTIFKIISCLLACLFHLSTQAQIDTAFVRHLENNHLQANYLQYINTRHGSSDSIDVLRLRYALLYQNDSTLLTQYQQHAQLFKNDTTLLNKISGRFLKSENYSHTKTWFENLPSTVQNKTLPQAFNMAEHSRSYEAGALPEKLQFSFESLQQASKKNAAMAGCLSALLPGAGKIYAGKTNSGLLTFVGCSAYALQWWESSRKLGNANAFTIVNATFFTAFYAANIYGAVKAVQQTKRERKQQFLNEVAQYYR